MGRSFCALVLVLILAACGGGSSNPGGGPVLQPPPEPPQQPNQRTTPRRATPVPLAEQAPILPLYRLGRGWWNIGIGGNLDTDELLERDRYVRRAHGGTMIYHTRLGPRPEGRRLVEVFLGEFDSADPVFSSPPTVRIASYSDRFTAHVVRIVQIVNTALPNDFQIRVADNLFTPGSVGIPPTREIHVEVRPKDQWPGEYSVRAIGRARTWHSQEAARIFLSPTFYREASDEDALRILGHEILHALGLNGHIEEDTDVLEELTLMVPHLHQYPGRFGDSILFPFDIAALQAMYDPHALGEWNRTHYRVDACLDGRVCFGASPGLGNPSAYARVMGVSPSTHLGNNQALIGSATWRGRLVGLTPREDAVAGAARLGINLDTLRGDLDFTHLEYWRVGTTIGRIGTGSQWKDGDLNYGIEVLGNTFIQDGTGDDGAVTGRFAGRSHEYMAGVLERDDLAAGFGGKR